MKLLRDFTRYTVKPKLIVFDLDHTLWPWGIDQFVYKPPYHRRYVNLLKISKDAAVPLNEPLLFKVFDSEQKEMEPFPEVNQILQTIKNELKIDMGVASRTEYPAGAHSLIELFAWQQYFRFREIYPGSKITHFAQFKKLASQPYDQMLFFDDEDRNIVDVGGLGVTCVKVDPNIGMNFDYLKDGLDQFQKEHS